MSHKRTLIRNALAALLTGLPTCGGHVYPSRLKPLSASELPAILITTLGEEPDMALMVSGRPIRRPLLARLDIVVKAVNGYEDTADAILGEIEGALFATPQPTLGGNALSIRLAGIAEPEADDSTDKPVICLPVAVEIVYTS